jgi:hypothetical protein
VSAALQFFPMAHEVWIEANTRIVNEHPAVDLANVHFPDFAGEEIIDGSFEVRRNINVFGKMVQGSHRQNTKRGVGARQFAGDGVDCSVAARFGAISGCA